jgi:DNA processing protein
MARGIDTAAHRGALAAKGRTIAVLGSGHNNIYPPENKKLYDQIAATGAVVTEFEDDVGPLPANFPRRNRIISGLSLGVVVVEAARNSGALITANFALEQGRDVFAVPGKISSLTSSGTNDLIKDGARLVQSADDIMEELHLAEMQPLTGKDREETDEAIAKMTKAYIYSSLTEDERSAYKTLSDEPLHIDDLLDKTGLNPAKASKVLLSLQLKGLVKEVPGKRYTRK